MSVMSSSLQWISAEKLLYFSATRAIIIIIIIIIINIFCVHACKDNK